MCDVRVCACMGKYLRIRVWRSIVRVFILNSLGVKVTLDQMCVMIVTYNREKSLPIESETRKLSALSKKLSIKIED